MTTVRHINPERFVNFFIKIENILGDIKKTV